MPTKGEIQHQEMEDDHVKAEETLKGATNFLKAREDGGGQEVLHTPNAFGGK